MFAFSGFPEGKYAFIACGDVVLRSKTTGRVSDPPLQSYAGKQQFNLQTGFFETLRFLSKKVDTLQKGVSDLLKIGFPACVKYDILNPLPEIIAAVLRYGYLVSYILYLESGVA